jgi:predicted permease
VQKLQTVDIGFDRDHLLLFSVRPGLNGYKDQQLVTYYTKLQQNIESLPGVRAAAFSTRPPIGAGQGSSGGVIVGYTPPDKQINFLRHSVGPHYFEALNVPVVAGRAIEERDNAQAPQVVVINERLAKTYFHNDNPLGHIINFGSRKDFEIVGVVKDVKYSRIRSDAPPTVYFSYVQFLSIPNQVTFEVHTTADPSSVVESVRREGLALDRNVPVVDVKTQAEVIDQAVFLERTLAALTTSFGALALLLACVGLYGTMSYAIARRTREIGIRMALGAKRRDILLGVISETIVIVIAGLIVGVPITLAATRVLKEQLFGLSPTDPLTTIAAVTLIATVTLVAGYLPARRAATVTPIEALRTE